MSGNVSGFGNFGFGNFGFGSFGFGNNSRPIINLTPRRPIDLLDPMIALSSITNTFYIPNFGRSSEDCIQLIENLTSELEDATNKIGEYQKKYLQTNDTKWEDLMNQQIERRENLEANLKSYQIEYEERKKMEIELKERVQTSEKDSTISNKTTLDYMW